MADDAGALLVRSGLVSAKALDDARARVANLGGTLGEQLVVDGVVTDDALTDFYRSRLLVPQVNPNTLARLTPKVVATIPSDMAIELRAIPVSLDGDNNLTVAMSDPSDRHAVDEIAFFTGAYIVRAVATQMQIAWCLAHYYGHVTALGQRLLYASESASPIRLASSESPRRAPRAKGQTGKVDAARHRTVAPITGPVNALRPISSELDPGQIAAPEAPATAPASTSAPASASTDRPSPHAPAPASSTTMPTSRPHITPSTDTPAVAPRITPSTSTPAAAPRITPSTGTPVAAPGTPPSTSTPAAAPRTTPSTSALAAAARINPSTSSPAAAPRITEASTPVAPPPPEPGPPTPPTPASMATSAPRTTPSSTSAAVPDGLDDPTPVIIELDDETPDNETPDDEEITERRPSSPDILAPSDDAAERPRARSVSGEIRVPVRRAASIRPPMPAPEADDDDEPLIVIEPGAPDDDTTDPRTPLRRRRAVKSDPPELYARAGEVDLKTGDDHSIDVDEPRIVIDENALATPTAVPANRPARRDDTAPPPTATDFEDADTSALIHDRIIDAESQPILLERPRATPATFQAPPATTPRATSAADPDETSIVVLETKKSRSRPERRTQVGIPPAPIPARPHRDTETTGIPTMLEHPEGDRTVPVDEDATTLDLRPAPRGDDSSDRIVAPPAPASYGDTNPHLLAPPPKPAPPRPSAPPPAMLAGDGHEDEDDDDEPSGPRTSVMTAVELDAAIPERTAEVVPGHLSRRRIEHDPVDDGWGPPGTTIPPPLLGAIPGSEDEDDDAPSAIPMPSVDSSPLIVEPPSQPSAGDAGGLALVRALEEATARAIQVIRRLEHAESRDEVVEVMVAHLAETHHRAGFFVARPGPAKAGTELGLFAMTPKPAVMPFATLRLDRPSTLQDVVGTRLPYRGPMHDDASRTFLISVLGACPPEILLVPVTVRERVVGVLFGEHRQRHTFDDQLALAARAAGMALERILKAKRG